MLPDRLMIDLENRNKKFLTEDEDDKKKTLKDQKMKGLKRKKRKNKTKGGRTSYNFERFSTHSNKTMVKG